MEFDLPKQKIISKTSLRGKLIENLLDFLFSNKYFIFGGVVRDYIIPKKKKCPNDFDIGVDSIKDAIENIERQLSFCFYFEKESIEYNKDIVHSKITLHYKFRDNMKFILDISPKKIIGSNLDFDINGIYMTEKFTYKIMDKLKDYSLSEITNNIQNKRFQIMKSFDIP